MNIDKKVTSNGFIVGLESVISIASKMVIEEGDMAGTKFIFNLLIVDTECQLNRALNGCPIKTGDDKNEQECLASVVSLGDYKKLTYSCSPKKVTTIELTGGLKALQLTDENALNVLQYIIDTMNNDSTVTTNGVTISLQYLTSVTSQVVAGVKYNFLFSVEETNCGVGASQTDCQLQYGTAKTCQASTVLLGSTYTFQMYGCTPLAIMPVSFSPLTSTISPIIIVDPMPSSTYTIMDGSSLVDPKDPTANSVLNYLIALMNTDRKVTKRYVYAKQSVVSIRSKFNLYNFKFTIGATTCRLNLGCKYCPFAAGKHARSQLCTASVVYQPMEVNMFSQISYDCNLSCAH